MLSTLVHIGSQLAEGFGFWGFGSCTKADSVWLKNWLASTNRIIFSRWLRSLLRCWRQFVSFEWGKIMHTKVKSQKKSQSTKNWHNMCRVRRLSPIVANPEALKTRILYEVLLFQLSEDAALGLGRVVDSRVQMLWWGGNTVAGVALDPRRN